MSNTVDIAAVEEVPDKGFIVRQAGDTGIVLCRVQGELYAVENRCSHAFQRFDEGRLRGTRLMCPLHGACFDVRDGRPLRPPARLPIRSFPVTVADGRVLVTVSGDTPSPL
ncbi:MAG: non-heme iron oxygenase ferredoxin subunit [Pseudomonadota bacterium]